MSQNDSDKKLVWYAPEGKYYKDHTIIEKDGLYHVFAISGDENTSWYYTDSESILSHSVSEDLVNWRYVDEVVPARGIMGSCEKFGLTQWREDKIWAPHCIFAKGKYWMFYAGIEHPELGPNDDTSNMGRIHVQRICLATSTDLEKWERYPEPLFVETPDMSSHPGHALRDPMVMWCEEKSKWLMYVTMCTEDYQLGVGVLESDDLLDWEYHGFAFLAEKGSNIITESPFVSKIEGSYYIFINKGILKSKDAYGPFTDFQPYNGEIACWGWGAGENIMVNGSLKRSLIGGHDGRIKENGKVYGGQLCVFNLEFIDGKFYYRSLTL